jgi:hypothetical protein
MPKDDMNKPTYLVAFRTFPRALAAVDRHMRAHAIKHGDNPREFLNVQDGYRRYSEALLRHVGRIGEGSALAHAVAVAANALIALEIALEHDTLEPSSEAQQLTLDRAAFLKDRYDGVPGGDHPNGKI